MYAEREVSTSWKYMSRSAVFGCCLLNLKNAYFSVPCHHRQRNPESWEQEFTVWVSRILNKHR